MPDHAPWPPPGGRHRTAGLSGPGRRYALIVLALAVTSSLPILAAIGPGAGQIGSALAGDGMAGTTPFIAPPSPDPIVVIPIRPGVVDRPPPLATLRTPVSSAAPPRQPRVQRTSARQQPTADATPDRARRATPPKAKRPTRPKVPAQRPRTEEAVRVVHKRKLWQNPPASLVGHSHHRHWHGRGRRGR